MCEYFYIGVYYIAIVYIKNNYKRGNNIINGSRRNFYLFNWLSNLCLLLSRNFTQSPTTVKSHESVYSEAEIR